MAGTEKTSVKDDVKVQDEACAGSDSSLLNQQCLDDISRNSGRTADRTSGLAGDSPLFLDLGKPQFSLTAGTDLTARVRGNDPGARDIVFDKIPALDQKLTPEMLSGKVEKTAGLPVEQIKVGARDYQVAAGPDGRVGGINIASPDGKSALVIQRDASGAMVVSNATGDFAPQNGKLNFEGIPLIVGADGKIQGELAFRANGDVKYTPSQGNDRVEITRKADGTTVYVDIGNWKRTVVSPDGQVNEKYWDGWEWRNGQMESDGRIKFQHEYNKPDFVKRDRENDRAVCTFNGGNNFECDFRAMKQTLNEVGPPPKQSVRYYNGAAYVESSGISTDPQTGDTTVQFKDVRPGEPSTAIYHKDGRVTTMRSDKTIVSKDQNGFVSSVTGPKGTWQFQRDVNGDIISTNHSWVDRDGRQMNEVLMREGRELYPGMELYRSRQGFNNPREPFDLPPRDMEKPIDYNTFVDANGNRQRMNINVTADGTVRIERSGGEGKTIVSFESPGQVMYQDLGANMVAEHPGGVIETFDKTSRESVFKFNRAGRDIELKSTDGTVQILTDGTVVQDRTATKTRDYYMPNGVVANLDASNAEKPVFKQVQFPGKDGKPVVLQNGQNGISDLQLLENMTVMATVTGANGAVQTVFNPKDSSRSEKGANDKFWKVMDSEGNFLGAAASPGEITWKNTAGGFAGPNGVTFESSKWTPANPAMGADGEILLTGKDGSTARLDVSGIAVESKNGVDTYRYPNARQARFENGKLKAVSVGNKIYQPELGAGDSVIALSEAGGSRLNAPAGAAYYFDKNMGEFLSTAEAKDGIQSGNMWDPANNTNTAWRNWNTANGQSVNLRVKMNDKRQVLEFNLPGSANVVTVPNNSDIKSTDLNAESGIFTVVMADGRTGTFSPDGSYAWQIPGSNTMKFDRNGVQVKTA